MRTHAMMSCHLLPGRCPGVIMEPLMARQDALYDVAMLGGAEDRYAFSSEF